MQLWSLRALYFKIYLGNIHRVDKNEDGRITEEEVKEVQKTLVLYSEIQTETKSFIFVYNWNFILIPFFY